MKELKDRSDEDLVQLMLEIYSRSIRNPNSEKMHNRSVEIQDEVMKRLARTTLKALRARVAGLIIDEAIVITQHSRGWNDALTEVGSLIDESE